jgi:HYR domain-containing protein
MKSLATIILLLLPLSICYAQPPAPNTVLTFYITDVNLATNHRGVMIISTDGLVDFTVNGIPIPGPSTMVETGIDTGIFQLQLTLPDTVGGRPLQNGDVVVMTYHQSADYSGNPQTITQSVVLNSIPSSPIESSAQNVRIGRDFTLVLDAPNFNLDSQVPDDIPLNLIEVRMGGVSTTLADPAFHVNTGSLRETGSNTGVFEATFKIPTAIDGFPVKIGATLEFTFVDNSQPSPSESSIFVHVGTYQSITEPPTAVLVPHNIAVQTTNPSGSVVNFLNSTVLQGFVEPTCFPSSGSFFPIGTTTVTCAAKDQAGNSVLKSFSVTVARQNNSIPHWITKLASFWCNGAISDDDIKTAMKFLIFNKLVVVSETQSQAGTIDKSYACLWANGKATDDEVSNLFYQFTR